MPVSPRAVRRCTATIASWLLAACPSAPSGPCPPEMALVGSVNAGSCVDRWEAAVHTSGSGDRVTSVAVSAAGQLPAQGLTWIAARDVCAATPMLDAKGNEVGRKRLARAQEWEDAGDGVWGEGGTRFPTGDSLPEGACASPPAHGPPLAFPDGAPATGSFPGCTSLFGVHDQIGGVWEWVDPGLVYDLAAVLEKTSGGEFRVNADDRIDGRIAELEVQWDRAPSIDSIGGPLTVRLDGHAPQPGQGWPKTAWIPLGVRDGGGEPEARLAVRLDPVERAETSARFALYVDRAMDGRPIAEKRGGAFYSGGGVDLRYRYRGHRPDFLGTIGFRCAGDVPQAATTP